VPLARLGLRLCERAIGFLLRLTIELAHALELRVIAEGVEDAETLEVLGGMGCDLAQGYYISEPIPDHATEAWMAGSSWMGVRA